MTLKNWEEQPGDEASSKQLTQNPYIYHVVKHFNLEASFTMKTLRSLEAAGIPLLSSLSNYAQIMQNALGLFPLHDLDLNFLLSYWVRNDTSIPPSWKNLLLVIRLLNLEDLAQLTEMFLRGTTSERMILPTKGIYYE